MRLPAYTWPIFVRVFHIRNGPLFLFRDTAIMSHRPPKYTCPMAQLGSGTKQVVVDASFVNGGRSFGREFSTPFHTFNGSLQQPRYLARVSAWRICCRDEHALIKWYSWLVHFIRTDRIRKSKRRTGDDECWTNSTAW